MAATWTITSTQYDIKGSKGDNQITTLHWECTDSEDVTTDGETVTHRGRVYGSIGIPEPSGDFIEYSVLTIVHVAAMFKLLLMLLILLLLL